MSRHATGYHVHQLAIDAAAMTTLAGRAARLLSDIRHEAAQARDAATAEALVGLADALADTAHDHWPSVTVAHDKACDEIGIGPIYTDDAEVVLAFGLAIKSEPAREELQRAVDDVAAAFKPLVPVGE